MTISAVLDLEWEILRASGVRADGDVVWETGAEMVRWTRFPGLSGEPSLRRSIDRTAFWSSASSISRPRSFPSPSSELSESGGEITAPVGMMWSLIGGGDWRTLLRVAKSAVWVAEGTFSVGVGRFEIEGDRLWRFMYEAEE